MGCLPYVLGSLAVGSTLGRFDVAVGAPAGTAWTLSLPCSGLVGLPVPLTLLDWASWPHRPDQGLPVAGLGVLWGATGRGKLFPAFNSAQCWAGAACPGIAEPGGHLLGPLLGERL